MILSDKSIREEIGSGRLKIDPYDPLLVNPASMDFKLGSGFYKVFVAPGHTIINPTNKDSFITKKVAEKKYKLKPKEFILSHTLETIEIPDYLAVEIKGKSSLGRLGVANSSVAGFADPGFGAPLTIEIFNYLDSEILLTEGMKIGQFLFHKLDAPAENPYNVTGRYNSQDPGAGSQGV